MSPPRHLRLLLGTLGVLALVAVLASDWNWARPAVVHYLRHTSQRDVRIDDLDLHLDARWQPVVRLRGVHVANAPWAGPRPFVTAREVGLTFDWATLFGPVRVVRELRLVEADIDLQRQPDGLRNWRLTRPDDRGAARMRIQRLQAERSRLTLTHRDIGLVLDARSTPLQAPPGPFRQRIDFQGTLRGAAYAGVAEAPSLLSMVDTGERFAVRGQARSGATELEVDGQVADLMQLAQADGRIALHGPTLAALKPFLPRADWPESKPYRFEARLQRQGRVWQGEAARLQLGRSELAGHGRYTPASSNARPRFEGAVTSELLRVDDLPRRAQPRHDQPSPTTRPGPPTRVLPRQALRLDSLRRIEGEATLQAARVQAPGLPELRGVRAQGRLDDGTLTLALTEAQWAGARWQGRITLDATPAEPRLDVQARADGLQLTALWPGLAAQRGVQWPALQSRLSLRGQGRSVAAWLGSVDGQIDLQASGGSLSRSLEARLGLNAGGLLRSLVQDKPVPIRCGAASVVFRDGVGRTRQLVLDTERTHLVGEGSVRLGDETWALVLTPQAQGRAPLALQASVLAQGTFRGYRYELAQREPLPRGSCADAGRAG